MRQQTVIAKANAPAARDPFDDETCDQIFPTEEEKRYKSENMKNDHKRDRAPIKALGTSRFKFDYILH